MIIFKTKNEQVAIKGDEYAIQWEIKGLEGEELFDAIVIETPLKKYSFVDISEDTETGDVIDLVQAAIAYINAHISEQIICVDFDKLVKNEKELTFELYVDKV